MEEAVNNSDYEVEFSIKTVASEGQVKMLGCGCGCSQNGSVSVSNVKLVELRLDGEKGLTVMQDSVDKYLGLTRPR
jgi:hypothetical protein